MANYSNLKAAINEVIKANGVGAITGDVLNQVLMAMVNSLGDGYIFMGAATPSTNPGSPDQNVFYLAYEGGTYTNFGALAVTQGFNILKLTGSTWSVEQLIGVDNVPTASSNNLVKSGGVQNELALGAVYDVSAKNPTAGSNNDGKWESLAALLSDANLNTLIPTSWRKGGMSIKFVQSSDNKYVQFRYKGTETTGTPNPFLDTENWAICDDEVLIENPEYIKAETDLKGRLLFWIKIDGSVDWAIGVPTPVKSYVDALIKEIKDGTEGTSLDGLNKVIEFLDGFSTSNTLDSLLNMKVDKILGKGLSTNDYTNEEKAVVNTMEIVENPEYMGVEVDAKGQILGGRNIDGTKFENMPVERPTFIEKSIFDEELRKNIIIDEKGRIISYRTKDGKKVENVGLIVKNLELKSYDYKELPITIDSNSIVNFAGVIKENNNVLPYESYVGDFEQVFKHFRLALVKDGVVQYFLKEDDVTKSENGFNAILDGSDGDVLLVNDKKIYYQIYGDKKNDTKFFSLVPFKFGGLESEALPIRGISPSMTYIDNINDDNHTEHYDNLGNGKQHFCRNSNYVANIAEMTGMVGKYIPSQDGQGNITYTYDSSKKFIDSGVYFPTNRLNQSTAEKAATNKNTGDVVYTNADILTREVMLSMMQAEFMTKDIMNVELYGIPFSAYGSPTNALFESGTASLDGCRFKTGNNWVCLPLIAAPFNTGKYLYEMLTNWRTPWEILEQHLVVSYANRSGIEENTWFVYNENEYKIKNLGKHGSSNFTCVVFKKFRSKIASGTTYNGNDVSGNDIEYVIHSGLYRGWVVDNSPQHWLTGINCLLDGNEPYHYKFYIEHNYRKYLMDKTYTPISSSELFDFEKTYQKVVDVYEDKTGTITGNINTEKCALIPKDSQMLYIPSLKIETGMKLANANTYPTSNNTEATPGYKIVTGVKSGYGPHYKTVDAYFLYAWHPREYTSAPTGYARFVCQNVIV